MTDLDQAREWAKANIDGGYFHNGDRALAAAEIIQSLPDQWVDAEKVQEIADDMSNWSIPGMLDTTDSVRLSQMMDGFIDRLNALLAPKLPTLADMTQEERKACQWMQAQVFPTASTLGIITNVDEYECSAIILFADGMAKNVPWDLVTPLPGEPKLKWPGSAVAEPPALPEGMRLADHEEYGRVVTSPWGDGVDDYKIFFLNEDVRAGADYEYAHESTLTFLDGEA